MAVLQEALNKIRAGEISQKRASEVYTIPMTLPDHMNGKRRGTKPLLPRVMSPEMEAAFSRKFIEPSDQGFGLTKYFVMVTAAEVR